MKLIGAGLFSFSWRAVPVAAIVLAGNWASSASGGDTLPPLSPEAVLASSQQHFPRILQSLAERRAAEGRAVQADGAFDLVFEVDGFSRLSGFYDGTAISGIARQGIEDFGASVYGGYKLSDGTFPIYEDVNYTNTGGTMRVGLLFSLLRDRDIDQRRFALTDSRLAVRQADFELLLTKLGVQQRALIAYWRWVAAGRQLAVYENLLKIAVERETGLKEQVRSGARAEVFLVENAQNITKRRILATDARRKFEVAANMLSYYYRGAGGDPLLPSSSQLPPEPPMGSLEDLSVDPETAMPEALARRPELQIVRTSIERATKRIALAENSLKPRLDLNFEVLDGLGSVAEGGPSRDSTDTIVGLAFSVPLQRREARGKLSEQQAQLEAMEQKQRLKENEIEIEISNILVDLRVAQDLLRLAELEVEQSETMRDAEVRRFASGASDFFLVNIREETAANALIRYHLADLERHVARTNYDTATVNTERLGIDDEYTGQ